MFEFLLTIAKWYGLIGVVAVLAWSVISIPTMFRKDPKQRATFKEWAIATSIIGIGWPLVATLCTWELIHEWNEMRKGN